ncbi:MAG: hypothetical protein ACYSWO_01050 [Planctomycetota bacterium]|jgi:uncharacterized protein YcfL
MKKLIVIMLLLFLAVGCTSYHKVTDLNTGKTYYTTQIEYKGSGAVDLKDGKTGARIVLPSSEVQEITKDEYNRGIYATDDEEDEE